MAAMKKYLICILLVMACASGCDNSVDPVVRNSEGYTIYGALDLRKDTSFIRVKDINVPLIADSTRTFEGLVRLRNITTGTESILQRKERVFDDITVFNFYTTEVQEITTYEIEVEREGRVITSAIATTPADAELTINDENPRCLDTIEFTIDPYLKDELISFFYGFVIQGQFLQASFVSPAQVQEGGAPFQTSFVVEEALQTVVSRNAPVLNPPLPETCSDLLDQNLYIEYIHYGPNFIQEVELDSVIVPGSFIRFGGLYDSTFSIPIDTEIRKLK